MSKQLARLDNQEADKVINNMVLSESEASHSDEEGAEAEVPEEMPVDRSQEHRIYNSMHADDDQITSGYSTISSGKEESYLNRHLVNAAAAKAAAKTLASLSTKPSMGGQDGLPGEMVRPSAPVRINQRVETKFEGHTE